MRRRFLRGSLRKLARELRLAEDLALESRARFLGEFGFGLLEDRKSSRFGFP
jgi:hypothetical protein